MVLPRPQQAELDVLALSTSFLTAYQLEKGLPVIEPKHYGDPSSLAQSLCDLFDAHELVYLQLIDTARGVRHTVRSYLCQFRTREQKRKILRRS